MRSLAEYQILLNLRDLRRLLRTGITAWMKGAARVWECVAVISLVGNDGLSQDVIDQRRTFRDRDDLAACEDPSQQIARHTDTSVNFRGQSATRAGHCLIATVFWGANNRGIMNKSS